MTVYEYSLWVSDSSRMAAVLPHPQEDGFWWGHAVGATIDNAVSTGTSTGYALELDCPLKAGANYTFEYNLIYSISGLGVGATFGLTLPTGGVISCGYSVMMAADGSNMRSAATTTLGTLIGSGSSFSGGGPWSCMITGAMKLNATENPVARLAFKGSGIGVSVTLHPNSCAYFQEL